MERASGAAVGSGTGRGVGAIDANGQTHHCRVSDRSLDPGCQHHDARARSRKTAIAATRHGSLGGERAIAVTAPGGNAGGRCTCAGRRQEAAGTEAATLGRAGSACAGSTRRVHSICTGCE